MLGVKACTMRVLQMGQDSMVSVQVVQVAMCMQGRNTTLISASMHTLQHLLSRSRSNWSFRDLTANKNYIDYKKSRDYNVYLSLSYGSNRCDLISQHILSVISEGTKLEHDPNYDKSNLNI